MGLVFGEAAEAWPFRHYELVDVRRIGTKVIRTEKESDQALVGLEHDAA